MGGTRQEAKKVSCCLTGMVVSYWRMSSVLARTNAWTKDYASQDALRQPRLPIVVNMYQNVNDSLLLNLVKGVTSPERVVRAGQSGGFGLLLRFRVILFCVAICQSWKGKGEDFFFKKRENKNSFDQDRVSSFFIFFYFFYKRGGRTRTI